MFWVYVAVGRIFSQHSTAAVRKVGAEPARVVSGWDCSRLSPRLHFCLSCYPRCTELHVSAGPGEEDALPGPLQEVMGSSGDAGPSHTEDRTLVPKYYHRHRAEAGPSGDREVRGEAPLAGVSTKRGVCLGAMWCWGGRGNHRFLHQETPQQDGKMCLGNWPVERPEAGIR